MQQISNFTCEVAKLDATEKPFHHLLQPLKEKCFNDAEYSSIKHMYALLYPSKRVTHISRFFQESKQMAINNEEYLSINSRSERSTTIAACWAGVSRIDHRVEAPLSDAHLVQFCKRVQSVFGKHLITPNMYMHCHLHSCVLDFGPLHGVWLYAFNLNTTMGFLGACHTIITL